jgi:hypothetical protein
MVIFGRKGGKNQPSHSYGVTSPRTSRQTSGGGFGLGDRGVSGGGRGFCRSGERRSRGNPKSRADERI